MEKNRLASLVSWWRTIATSLLALSLVGCASFYVDGNTKEVPVSEFNKPAQPARVQMFFEFQTKGVANVRGTAFLKPKAVSQVKESGLFSDVSEVSVPGAGTLSITLNNMPLSDDAFSKGFVTGLTFGLAGSQVSDGYVCTAKFTPSSGKDAVVKTARHAIHTTLGAASTPGNATKVDSIEDAVYTMTRQILSQVLNDLSKDPNFKP